jgi:hypothetical protein
MADQGTGQGLHGRDRPSPSATVNATDAAKGMTQKMALTTDTGDPVGLGLGHHFQVKQEKKPLK